MWAHIPMCCVHATYVQYTELCVPVNQRLNVNIDVVTLCGLFYVALCEARRLLPVEC